MRMKFAVATLVAILASAQRRLRSGLRALLHVRFRGGPGRAALPRLRNSRAADSRARPVSRRDVPALPPRSCRNGIAQRFHAPPSYLQAEARHFSNNGVAAERLWVLPGTPNLPIGDLKPADRRDWRSRASLLLSTALRTSCATRSICSRVISGYSGMDSTSRAARSLTRKSPGFPPSNA